MVFIFKKFPLNFRYIPKKKITYKKVLNALKMQLEGGEKNFFFQLNTFCRLYNTARDLQGQGKKPFSVKKIENSTLKTHQFDRQLWADEPGQQLLN